MNKTDRQKIIEELEKLGTSHVSTGLVNHTQQLPLMAKLMAILADEQAQSAEKLERATGDLVGLTKKLVCLTWVVLIFTVVLLAEGAVQIVVTWK